MSERADLLKFMREKGIPLRLAIELLQQEEKIRRERKEKAVVKGCETRGLDSPNHRVWAG